MGGDLTKSSLMNRRKEVAEKCGVSIGTVDRVLHNRGSVKPETRNRVWQAARELDYRPNQAAQGLAIRKKLDFVPFVPERTPASVFTLRRKDIAWNRPKGLPYPTENLWA